MEGVQTQVGLDKLNEELEWDFLSAAGKAVLEECEEAPNLQHSHWAPESKSFSTARGKPIWLSDGSWTYGPNAVRSKEHPEGFPYLSSHDQVLVRRGNAMAKRCLKSLKTAQERKRWASLEHLWDSYLWDLEEAQFLKDENCYCSEFSMCCHGGRTIRWTCLVHNLRELHEELHRPECPGHKGVLPYEVHDDLWRVTVCVTLPKRRNTR